MMMDIAEREYKANQDTLIGNSDAKVWAEAFVLTVKHNPKIASDEETMIGWFANAIMAGYDLGVKHAENKTQGDSE